MEVLINELSLDGQFSDENDFLEKSLYILEVLKLMKKFDFIHLKKEDFCESKISNKLTFFNLLKIRDSKYKLELDTIRVFKRFFSPLYGEPYWNETQKHNLNDIYLYNLQNINNSSLAESCERDRVVLSFKHNDFLSENLKVQRNEEDIDIYNIFEKNLFLDFLIFNSQIDLINYFNFRFKNLELIKNLNRYPLIEFIESQKIELKHSIIAIVLEFFYLKNNNLKIDENLSKNLGKGLFELRGNFEDGIFRIFYFYNNDDIVFINGFIKKSNQTPKNEIENARKIKIEYKG